MDTRIGSITKGCGGEKNLRRIVIRMKTINGASKTDPRAAQQIFRKVTFGRLGPRIKERGWLMIERTDPVQEEADVRGGAGTVAAPGREGKSRPPSEPTARCGSGKKEEPLKRNS